ncbi:MAG: Zn-ribbon domain-containing OB-fold protein [Dehalococcoidia bacterium]
MTALKPQGDAIPLPRMSPLSVPYWEACRRGELMVQRCEDCGHHVFIPQVACTRCFSARLEWVQSSGRGTVYSYTIVYRPQQPAFEVPYAVAIVEMEEGWHTLTNIVGCEPEDVVVGLAVEVQFHAISDEITLPLFSPV